MPRRVGNDLYFTVESPRTTRIGKDAFVDDYTGHRMLDLWKGELVDSLEREGEVFIFGDPALNLTPYFMMVWFLIPKALMLVLLVKLM